MTNKNAVIIVAGGKGERLGSKTPKQFLVCAGLPILMHTMRAFHNYDEAINIFLVLPKQHIDYWNILVSKHQFNIAHKVVEGGEERFYSVKNAIDLLDESYSFVAIHDGVRPLVSQQTIANCFNTAKQADCAIPVHNLTESIRRIEENKSIALDRSNYKLVQTPQVFKSAIIKDSYKQPFSKTFTDDASVVEAAGYDVRLVEGNAENIKITTPLDLSLASICLNEVKK